MDRGRFQRLVGKLIYLSHTRPDIGFEVSYISQFMHAPLEEHMAAANQVLRYLKGTLGRGLFFKKTLIVELKHSQMQIGLALLWIEDQLLDIVLLFGET